MQSQLFSDKLKKTLNAYHNRAISTMEVIEELIKLAKEMDAATKRGNDLGLTDDEVAFYDALAANGSAKQTMGDAKLKVIAAELITKVRKSVTIDWTLRESARAKIRVIVKRILAATVSARLARGGGEDRADAGGVAVRGLGVSVSRARNGRLPP